jgi:oligosaccharyl transferase (archaeosortase A-associated)
MDREKSYESLEVLAVFLLALILRLYAGRNALQGGNVLLVGYDEFYHMRRILYTIGHFPNTIWFDSYLDYPHGLDITWPPLFDQLLAAVSLVLGQHSQHGIEMVAATMPVILGSIAIVAVYYMVREIFNRKVALMSAFMTTLAPYFLQKSMLAETDHHVLEVLLLIIAIMFLVMALSRMERRYVYAAAAGVFMAGLAYTWLGSSAYFGMILVYAIVQMTLDLKNGISSKETVTTLLLAFAVSLVLTSPFWNTPWLSPSFFGTAAIMIALLGLFSMSKLIAKKGLHWAALPIVVVVLACAFALLPQLMSGVWIFSKLDMIIRSGGDYLFSGGMVGKISEAEPLFARPEILFSNLIFSNLGWNLLFSVMGVAVLISYMWHSWQSIEKKEGMLLFLVFAILTLILTIGQIRFLYLSSITMGILISILFFRTVEYISQRMVNLSANLRLSILLLLFIILVLPTILEAVSITEAVPQIAGDWYESLNWLEQNSNSTSWYDNPDKTPEYGVMSWWDYGNWIIYQARRPVVANNFQTGIADASKFYLSESEDIAMAVLDVRKTKYVITDYDMLYGKLSAIAIWANKDPSQYQSIQDMGPYMAVVPTKKLYQTTLALLHFIDGSSLGHLRLIHESHSIVGQNPPTSSLKIFEYVPGAVIRVSPAPKQKLVALVNMTSNQGRKFMYVNEGISEVKVPYSTEKRYDTHAITPYLLVSVNSPTDMKTKNINVTEDDVLHGKIINVTL